MRWDVKPLAALSGLVLLLLLAACNLSTQPDPASQALAGVPAVQIVAPLPNATYLEGVTVNVQAQIQNAGPDLARVDFAVDNQVFASLTEPNSAGATVLSVSESWVSSGTGAHSLSVSAVRGDGSFSVPVSVTITVVGQVSRPSPADSGSTAGGSTGSGDGGQQPPEQAQEPDRPAPAPEPTSDRPMARFLRGANVRSGPDTRFAPPIGSIAAGDQAELLAINIHKTWYKIKYYNSEGWVFGSLLEASGNVDDLPVVYGPPLPAPTAIPVTAVPPTAVLNVNLVAGNMRHNAAGGTITCGIGFRVEVDVANVGSTRSPGGNVRFLDYATKRDGGRLEPQIEAEVIGTFPPIEPGQTVSASASITVNVHHGENHILWAYVNHDNSVPEADKGNNVNHFTYTLQKEGLVVADLCAWPRFTVPRATRGRVRPGPAEPAPGVAAAPWPG